MSLSNKLFFLSFLGTNFNSGEDFWCKRRRVINTMDSNSDIVVYNKNDFMRKFDEI